MLKAYAVIISLAFVGTLGYTVYQNQTFELRCASAGIDAAKSGLDAFKKYRGN